MLNQVRNIFAAPVFHEDEDKTRKAGYANVILYAILGMVIAFEVLGRVSGDFTKLDYFELILLGLGIFCIAGLVLLRKGHVRITSILLIALVWLAANGLAATGFGARDSSFLANFAIILMAGLLLGWQSSIIFTLLTALSGFALAYAEQYELIVVTPYPILFFARDITFTLCLTGILIYLLIAGLENALKRSRSNFQELHSTIFNLHSTQSELQNRTADLIIANKQLENRSKKLQAVTVIAHTTASIQNFDHLLDSITNTISNQLEYYHVGLFLLDEQKQTAILRAANTESGKRMRSQGYRLPINQSGIFGLVVQTGKPRIIHDKGEDAADLQRRDFPQTRSEILLPLESGDQIIGILDIHSTEENAFSEDDLSSLSILADQVAITIQNSLLYEKSQSALREAGITSSQISSDAWKGYEKKISTKGYRYDGIKSEPLKINRMPNGEKEALLIPVQLRGQTIGRLKLSIPDSSREWTEDELAIARATAERVALALESARLLDEAQKRATREAFLSEVSTKLSSSFQLDSILRDTVQELGQTLKNSTVTFQLVNPAATAMTQEEQPNGASAHTQESDSSNEH